MKSFSIVSALKYGTAYVNDTQKPMVLADKGVAIFAFPDFL